MRELIDVFKMEEVSIKTRVKLIKKLGEAINCKFASNITESLVIELVLALDPDSKILEEEHYARYLD